MSGLVFWVCSLFLRFFVDVVSVFLGFFKRERSGSNRTPPHALICLFLFSFCPAALGLSSVVAVRLASWPVLRFFRVLSVLVFFCRGFSVTNSVSGFGGFCRGIFPPYPRILSARRGKCCSFFFFFMLFFHQSPICLRFFLGGFFAMSFGLGVRGSWGGFSGPETPHFCFPKAAKKRRDGAFSTRFWVTNSVLVMGDVLCMVLGVRFVWASVQDTGSFFSPFSGSAFLRSFSLSLPLPLLLLILLFWGPARTLRTWQFGLQFLSRLNCPATNQHKPMNTSSGSSDAFVGNQTSLRRMWVTQNGMRVISLCTLPPPNVQNRDCQT